jgi:hypothetical protein
MLKLAPHTQVADRAPAAGHGAEKVRATLYVSADVLDEARNAAVFLAGYPLRLTLTSLVDRALRAELERLRNEYQNGQAFPLRTAELKGGRPIAA